MDYEVKRQLLNAINRSELSPEKIANCCGLGVSTVRAWFLFPKRMPNLRTVAVVAELLGFSIDLTGAEPRLVAKTPAPLRSGRMGETSGRPLLSGPRMRMLLRSLQ